MSFKRDGDDFSQLNILKKRRVDELLAHHIPDDEAYLMSNGRYACIVCHYRPVFDTIQMLTIHRQGKKHQQCLETHCKKKREYMQLLEKRNHEEYLKQEEDSGRQQKQNDDLPLLKETCEKTRNILLKTMPYRSSVKWERPKLCCIKEESSSFFESTRNEKLKRITDTEVNVISESINQHSKRKHVGLLKHKAASTSTQEYCQLKPYVSKRKNNDHNSCHFKSNSDTSSYSQENETNFKVDEQPVSKNLNACTSWQDSISKKSNKINTQLSSEKNSNFKERSTTELTSVTNKKEKNAEMEHILKMTSSGWKRSREGNWIKDEDVEFDSSDEDESI